MNLARLAALAAFSLLTLAAPAIAAEPQAGLWKVTIKGGPPGMPAQARENTMCITPEMVKDPGKAFTDPARQRPGMENCKQLGVQKTANGFTWRVQCTTAQMTMDTSGTWTFDSPTHYTAVIKSNGNVGGRAINNEMAFEGQRVGDCQK